MVKSFVLHTFVLIVCVSEQTCSRAQTLWIRPCSRKIGLWKAARPPQRRWTWRACRQSRCSAHSSANWPHSQTQPAEQRWRHLETSNLQTNGDVSAGDLKKNIGLVWLGSWPVNCYWCLGQTNKFVHPGLSLTDYLTVFWPFGHISSNATHLRISTFTSATPMLAYDITKATSFNEVTGTPVVSCLQTKALFLCHIKRNLWDETDLLNSYL